MKAIGGYFELELPLLPKREHYHANSIKLNTGRCAFEYILRVRNYKKIYLPYYTCDVMLEPIEKLGLEYEFYKVDQNLDPIFDKQIGSGEVFVYNNYFGVKQNTVEKIAQNINNIIIDNSQAFFAPVLQGVDTFYSARKFMGVPDGAYLYIDIKSEDSIENDYSYDRCSHLLKRLESDAEAGYVDFCRNDQSLTGQSIKRMSGLTEQLLSRIDYDKIIKCRRENFVSLHCALAESNDFVFDMEAGDVAMVYPYLCEGGADLRRKLIENKIFVAKYWPNVAEWTKEVTELYMSENLVLLPIDQRLTENDMQRIIEIVLQ